MMARRSTKRRPRVVGVIASRADLERAVRMRRPPDLFELRLDRLAGHGRSKWKTSYRSSAHRSSSQRGIRTKAARQIAAAATAGSARSIFELTPTIIDVELRSAPALRSYSRSPKTKNVRRIISFQLHNFKSTPSARILAAKARKAKSHGADIFKVATRTDTPTELGRLLEFITKNRVNVRLAVMGIGRLGAISRVLLARAGSVLIYASVGAATDVEGQLSLEQLRALGFGP